MFSKRYVVSIVEQPAKAHRSKTNEEDEINENRPMEEIEDGFRYASEIDTTRTAGSIAGVSDRPNNRTYPTICVKGYYGPMLVMLCLVNPHDKLVHPHAITGKEEANRREFKAGAMLVYTNGPEVTFNNIGILCVKGKSKKDIRKALRLRETCNIDPFTKGFEHMEKHEQINLDAVRLCFNVFLPAPGWTEADRSNPEMYTQPLDAVLSDVIYDIKKLSDLKIVQLLECNGSMQGGTKIVLLCENYGKDPPPEVVFMERGWMATADVTIHHKKVTLVFLTPPYRDPKRSQPVEVEVCLRKKNVEGDMEYSAPVMFTYIPEQWAKNRPPADYLPSLQLKATLSRVPYAHSAEPPFIEIPPSKQEFIDVTPSSSAAHSQTLDSWLQPSTSSNLNFLPQPSHISKNDNVTRRQRVNDVGSGIDIFSVPPDFLQQALLTSSDVESFFQSDYSILNNGNLLQNSVAVKPNVVTDNFIHYDQTPDIISGANGGVIRNDFLHDEDLVHLCEGLVDIRNQNPFESDTDAEMLSGELKNLQLQCQNDDFVKEYVAS